MSSEPSSDFYIPEDPHVSLAPCAALTDEGFILDHSDIVDLHNHSKRTDNLPTDAESVADHHDIASHAVEDNKEHLESLASIYSVKKERSSQIRETLNTICDGIDADIIKVSQNFENLYPQLHQKIRSRDIAAVDGILNNLQNSVRGLVRKTAHAVDVLEEAKKSVQYGKHHHDNLHDNKANGLFENKDDTLDSIGGLVIPVRTIILIIEGSFSRTLVNLGVVKAEVDHGETNPHTIFVENSVDEVTSAWRSLKEQAQHHQANNEMTNPR
jgi:hypothetical protein